jgi:hypothetical protein
MTPQEFEAVAERIIAESKAREASFRDEISIMSPDKTGQPATRPNPSDPLNLGISAPQPSGRANDPLNLGIH